MTVLVMGATGNVGGAIVDAFGGAWDGGEGGQPA